MSRTVASYYFGLWARTAAVFFLCASIMSLFLLSSSVLDNFGYHYDVAGESILEKLHPATFLVVFCLVLRIASEDTPIDAIRKVFLRDRNLIIALASFVVLEIYVVLALRVPATPPIDTYLLPVLYCFALRGLNARLIRMLAVIIFVIFAANAAIAVYERLAETRLIFVIPDDITGHPEDPSAKFDWKGHLAWDWRSSAMFGHPLENALLTGCFALIMGSRACGWIPAWIRGGIIVVQVTAMLTFGGRVALVFVGLVGAAWVALRGIQGFKAGKTLTIRHRYSLVLFTLVLLLTILTLYDLGMMDKFVERFVDDDGSAQTRLTMWRLFSPISWSDIILGPDPDTVATYQRLEGLELGIESFWAGLPLTYGLVMTLIVISGWVSLCFYLVGVTGYDACYVIAFFFAVSSGSAGLASKTTSIGILVVLVLILMAKRPNYRESTS